MAELPVAGDRSRRVADLAVKLRRVAEVAAAHDVTHVVVRDPATLAWLFECRVHVPQTLDTACFAAHIDTADGTGSTGAGGVPGPRVRIIANAIEAPRLAETELAGLDVDWQVLPWWEPVTDHLPHGPGVGSDQPGLGTVDLAAELAALRRVLTRRQQRLLAGISAETAAIVADVASQLTPQSTENAAAGMLAEALLGAALEPIVLMVGGGDRPERHRHPLPTAAPLGERAMLVCCARRHGLVASCTRIVAFGQPADGDLVRYRALLGVEAAFLDATVPGAPLGDVVAAGADAYARRGFNPDEWHRHHQGGLTGVKPREFPAHPGSKVELAEGMAVGWNPSGAGWKVEDTCLVGDDGARPLVHAAGWPTLTIAGRARPDIWVR